MELNEKLQKAIAEDMPKQVGEQLQKLLKQGEEDAKSLRIASLANEQANIKIDQLQNELKHKNSQIEQHAKLSKREKEITDRERNFQITELTIKLEESEKRATMVQDFTSSLVRNTIVRKSILDSESTDTPAYYDNNGMQTGGGHKNTTKNYNEDKEQL